MLEFEYAKAAIQIGVEEYLLKPINGDELLHSSQFSGEPGIIRNGGCWRRLS